MCINPAQMPNGAWVGCRKCWQCKENKAQDWVGRCIAESRTADKTYAFTLTYGDGDHPSATILTYSDVQKWFKRLRFAGYKFSYLVAGEYGKAKGRAHWHGALFFYGKAPEWPIRQRFHCEHWQHGFSYMDEPHPSAFKYAAKYCVKDDQDEQAQGLLRSSKAPPLGHRYFAELAEQYVAQRIAPQDLLYMFKDNVDKNGKLVKHYMHHASARDFLSHFVHTWDAQFPHEHHPPSALVEEHIDKYTQYAEPLRFKQRQYGVKPQRAPRDGVEIRFSETRNLHYCEIDGKTYHWRKTIDNEDIPWSWHDENRLEVPIGSLNPRPEPTGTTPSGTPGQTPSETLPSARKLPERQAIMLSELVRRQKEATRNSRGKLPMVGDPGWGPRPPSPEPITPTR